MRKVSLAGFRVSSGHKEVHARAFEMLGPGGKKLMCKEGEGERREKGRQQHG